MRRTNCYELPGNLRHWYTVALCYYVVSVRLATECLLRTNAGRKLTGGIFHLFPRIGLRRPLSWFRSSAGSPSGAFHPPTGAADCTAIGIEDNEMSRSFWPIFRKCVGSRDILQNSRANVLCFWNVVISAPCTKIIGLQKNNAKTITVYISNLLNFDKFGIVLHIFSVVRKLGNLR